jgi:acetylornithine deacetylase/succinyl-diaminopimelate desuccinylase-like protein
VVVELLQGLIRNACVNDGRVESGQEVRNARLLADYFAGSPLELETFEPEPGRTSLLARLAGSDPDAPTLCLLAHTDVVPASPERWRHDPFGGELVDGEVWGRGAVDMLNLAASMAVASRHLAEGGPLRGTLLYLAVADEEAGGAHGAGWLTEHAWDRIGCDYVLTEMGGVPIDGRDGRRLWMVIGEKGLAWRRLRIRGTPGHGSLPFASDNALVTAAEVVQRLAAYRPPARLDDAFRVRVEGLEIDEDSRGALVDPARVWEGLESLADVGTARQLHSISHTTFSPNVIRGGCKTNVIPDEVEIEVDIRLLPGESEEAVDAHLSAALGELYGRLVVEPLQGQQASASPTDTALFRSLERHMGAAYDGAPLLPSGIAAGTDARFFRARGAVCYGAGLYSDTLGLDEFWSRFHGDDERIDVRSLELTTGLWLDVARDLLG